jgi:DNA-binding transcriptional LysR family regulator
MEMHQVRYFLAVARTLNFTRAAEECNVAQPSLTRAIKQLEDEFGGDLFRRERNLSHLTDLGQRMLPMLQQCYDSAMAAKSVAQSIKKGSVAALTIALSEAIDIALLITFITELARALPGLELRFRRGSCRDAAEWLKKGEAEVCLSGPLGETWDRLESWHLFRESYVAVLPARHPLAAKKILTIPDLAKERFLCRPYCEKLEELSAALKSGGVEIDAGHKAGTERDILELIGANIGVSIMPKSSANAEMIACKPLQDLNVTRDVSIYAVAGRQRSSAASTLIKLLRAADWSELGVGRAT